MAPEINEGKVYDGIEVDLYSAGVCLFIFLNQNPPFGKACKSDPMFNCFRDISKVHKFWQVHETSLHREVKQIS